MRGTLRAPASLIASSQSAFQSIPWPGMSLCLPPCCDASSVSATRNVVMEASLPEQTPRPGFVVCWHADAALAGAPDGRRLRGVLRRGAAPQPGRERRDVGAPEPRREGRVALPFLAVSDDGVPARSR